MWSTDTGRKLVDTAFRWALIAGVVLAGLVVWALWAVFVAVAPYVVTVTVALWDASFYIVAFELLVIGSARMDHIEAELGTESWKHAWLSGHLTVFKRAWGRGKWVVSLGEVAVKQFAKTPTLDDLNVEARPLPLIVLEHDQNEAGMAA